jgi:hypothetical protein
MPVTLRVGMGEGVHFVRLLHDPGTNTETPVEVPSGGTKILEVNIANGGAAATPFNLMLTNLTYMPVEEPPE